MTPIERIEALAQAALAYGEELSERGEENMGLFYQGKGTGLLQAAVILHTADDVRV